MKYKNIREEELKNKVGADWFKEFDTTEILGNIDFTIFPKQNSLLGRTPLLWAEAKTGNFDVPTMFVQLILTIGKARTFDKTLPPAFLGAFDFQKIAFVDYSTIQDIFYINDFNWNVTPSNHETKEFKLVKERVEKILKENTYIFDFEKDDNELRGFIKNNIANATTTSKIKIDKNNFIPIYLRWIETVKPTIDVNWEQLNKANIFDSDFYLADLFVDDKDTQSIEDDSTIRDNLFVVFQNQGYKIAKENLKQMFDATINIKNKDMYSQFWKLYKRPPLKEFQDYIIERRDLLTPQDIRERKGAFFTPRIWVELSQKYLTDYLGENWQDEYYIWDCAAGTGNLLAGLTNKYNIYASTLDQADVNVMHERIEHGANLLKNNVFQFDFLNDEFTKLPQSLQDIINDDEKRKKLVIYINPPYAEATQNYGKNTKKAVEQHKTNEKYAVFLKQANRELFAQFLAKIYFEINGCIIAEFSKLKTLSGQHFVDFRNFFLTKLEKAFVVPADTFDNVTGQFPIGFKIWNTSKNEKFKEVTADVYDKKGGYFGVKNYYAYDNSHYINDWIKPFRSLKNNTSNIAKFPFVGNDFQTQPMVKIVNIQVEYIKSAGQFFINSNNLIESTIYIAVRHCINATWLNDRDQFLKPNDGWQTDTEFQNDCLTYTLFHSNNSIQSKFGTNNWIPFTEQEVNAQARFESHFMTDFINGKIKVEEEVVLFGSASSANQKREFSAEAKAVFDAGRELWSYYHKQPNVNVNASLYDIREYFQGRNAKGRMNPKSNDSNYMELIGELRNQLNFLADKIKPKIYEYEFLKE
jgi:16S rRNA G966 N2-methylase RsmD